MPKSNRLPISKSAMDKLGTRLAANRLTDDDELDGSTAATNDTAARIVDQYLRTVAYSARVVLR